MPPGPYYKDFHDFPHDLLLYGDAWPPGVPQEAPLTEALEPYPMVYLEMESDTDFPKESHFAVLIGLQKRGDLNGSLV